MYYSGSDPYAVRMAFHVGTDEPVEWIFARDLLAAGIESRHGEGDVLVWPSPVSCAETDAPDVTGPVDASGAVLISSCRPHLARPTLKRQRSQCRRSSSAPTESFRPAGKATTSISRRN